MSLEIAMITIYIDNKPFEVSEGQNLLDAGLALGFDIPYFCWHPALGSVGACRLCAIKQFRDEHDTKGKIVMSCMTPAAEGMRISIDDPDAKAFRTRVIEWLMVNHPHDCPVCDEGGECHLQDMTIMTGHAYRSYRFRKRTFRNQYMGPFINHEMNRCIQCYRCIRFYRDYAGGRDLNVFGAHDHVFFGRHKEGILDNEFSGNLIEVCPTGVFTDKTLKKHYARKWDLQTSPSVCVHCGLGCNIIAGEHYGKLLRILNRYNAEVNRYFLCDRGRFGYEFVNSDRRVHQPLRQLPTAEKTTNGNLLEPLTREEIIRHLEPLLYFGAKVIGIGSPRASLEANYALRTLVGQDHFYLGMSDQDSRMIQLIISILQTGPARTPSLSDVASADAVFVLGEDVMNVAPMLALSLRHSIRQRPLRIAEKLKIPPWHDYAVRDALQNDQGPFFVASPSATRLDEIATRSFRAAPDDLASLGFAVARALDTAMPSSQEMPQGLAPLAKEIAHALKEAQRPLIISGMSCGSESLIKAAANIAWALCDQGHPAALCFTVPECNSMGVGLIGGGSMTEAFRKVDGGEADTVIILENDLYRRAERKAVDAFFDKGAHMIVVDSLLTETALSAEIVLPASSYAEATGTLINNEGRAQRFFKVFEPDDASCESWQWLRDLMEIAGRPEAEKWRSHSDILVSIAESNDAFKAVSSIAPQADFRISGMKIPRQSPRYSGRTATHANISVHEPKPDDDQDTPLSFSMEGYEGEPPAALITRYWVPGWNSAQALNRFKSGVTGPLSKSEPSPRLIEPTEMATGTRFAEVPSHFDAGSGERLIVPIYHIFGSEELSALAPGIAQMTLQPYLGLNPDDMTFFKVREPQEVEFALHGTLFRLPVKSVPSLPAGVAGLPTGLPGLTGLLLPAWAKGFKPAEHEGPS